MAAEARITVHIIRAAILIPEVLPDRLTDLPVLRTGHQVHLTDRHIRTIQAERIIPEVIQVEVPAEADADVQEFSVS